MTQRTITSLQKYFSDRGVTLSERPGSIKTYVAKVAGYQFVVFNKFISVYAPNGSTEDFTKVSEVKAYLKSEGIFK